MAHPTPDFPANLKIVMDAIRAAEVPEALQELALARGLDAMLGTSPPTAKSIGTAAEVSSSDSSRDVAAPATGLQAIAHRLGVDLEVVEDVYAMNGDGVEIIVSPGRLSKRQAAATKEIAILVAVAHQAGVGEEWTPMSSVRDAVAEFNKLDSSNFSSTIREMDDVFAMRNPTPRKRELKLHRVGWERATETVTAFSLGGQAG